VRHHLTRPAALLAGLTVVTAGFAAAGSGAARAAAHAGSPIVRARSGPAQDVFLIDGHRVRVSATAQGTAQVTGATDADGCLTISNVGGPAQGAGPLQALTVGAASYAFPRALLPWLGHGLDLSLFDVRALAAAESARGRLPVLLHYRGHRPDLPGVTVTGARGGVATGYLTATGAATFGAALYKEAPYGEAKFPAVRPGAAGRGGLFAGGASLTLATTAPRSPAGAPSATAAGQPLQEVTVDATNRRGKPDNGDVVWLFNADNSSRFDNIGNSQATFFRGQARFIVPAGHYWALGDFVVPNPDGLTFREYLDVLPQFTAIRKAATVHLSAQAATSEIHAVTARPGTGQYTMFQLDRMAAAGPAISVSWLENYGGGPHAPTPSLYVSPTRAAPSTGKLATVTEQQISSATSPGASQYLYNLAYRSAGIIPTQSHVISQASLTALHLRYYTAKPSTGLVATYPVFAAAGGCPVPLGAEATERFPAQQTVYVPDHPGMSWETQDVLNQGEEYSGGQQSQPQQFAPGTSVTGNFGAYPLHPAPDYRVGDAPDLLPTQASASRAGNTLRLALTAFSDSVPGHTSQGTYAPVRSGGNYEIQQNGRRVAYGSLGWFGGPFSAVATLKPEPSVITFTLNTRNSIAVSPLSNVTHTVWTWRSAHESGATLPAGWSCLEGGAADRACAVQPMMTLRYGVVGEDLAGTVAPGQQVVRVTAGHLPYAPWSAVTRVTLAASFDGGRTWHAARMSGRGTGWSAVFGAPAGAKVMLRTSAADAAGGSVTETIANAYRIAT